MKVYFEEIKYNGMPLIWEPDQTNTLATASRVHVKENETTEITAPSLEHLSWKTGEISIKDNLFVVNDLSNLIRLHKLTGVYLLDKFDENTPRSPTLSKRSSSFTHRSISTRPSSRTYSSSSINSPQAETFSLEKMMKTDSTLWGKTFAYIRVVDQGERKIGELAATVILSRDMCLSFKKMQLSQKVSELKCKTISILKDIVDNYFDKVLKSFPLSPGEYKVHEKQILTWAENIFCDEGLGIPLDHEACQQEMTANLTPEHRERFELSKKLELMRAQAYSSHFAYHNLPDYFQKNMEKLKLEKEYSSIYTKLCESMLEIGKQLRSNAWELNNLKIPEFVSLESIVDDIFSDVSINSSSSVKKHHLFSKPVNSAPISPKTLLFEKLNEALIELLEDFNLHQKTLNSKYPNLKFSKGKSLYINAKHAKSFLVFLKKELKIENNAEALKNVSKTIEACKTKQLVEALNGWFSQFKLHDCLTFNN